MSIVPYWKERLEERRPIRELAYWVENYDWKPQPDAPADTWPRMVAKQALWKDYCAWFEDVYLLPFRTSPYFIDFPDQLPVPCTEVEFWHTMSPYLYLSGRPKMQTRGYFVWTQKKHMDEWVRCKVHRNFIRLGTWEEHLAQFALLTGGPSDPSKCVDLLGGAMRRMQATNDANRSRLPKAMRKADNG
jgi:hypothetical protein